MAPSCPGVRREPLGNDDSVDGAGVPLVAVKFDDEVGIIKEAENSDDNMAVAELTGGESTKGKQGFQSH